jgi:dUTP pyrophosphatase
MQHGSSSNTVPIVLSEGAKMPSRGSAYSAGADLYANESKTLGPGEFGTIKTGIRVALPENRYGRIAPRSGLAAKHGIDVLAGVIDSDYRGEILVVLINHGKLPFKVEKGMAIAQLIVEKCQLVTFVSSPDRFDSTGRGERGFGSTDAH